VWQFALATPTHVSPAVGVDRFQGYLPADPLSASVQPLPPSFEIARGCSNTASIEYYLEVRMLVTNGGVMYETHRVTVPLLIRSLHPGLPLRSFQMSFLLWPGHVGSQCLVPGMTEADLSATQKFKKFLHTSSVPQFHFYLEVGLPTHVQLDGVCSTPFNLRVVPDWPKTTEGIRNISQMVHLAGVELELASRTEVLHDQDGGPHDDVIVNAVGFSMNQALGVVRKEIRLPCHPSSQPLNIGDLTKLRFQSQALPTTYPSLETYNIRYRHRLVWKITLRIVGEDRKIRGDTPVVILPPSFGQPMVLSPMPRPPPHTSVPASSLSSHSIQTNASRPAPVCRSEQSDTLPNPPPPPYSLHPPEI
jgi:hypothetical protein